MKKIFLLVLITLSVFISYGQSYRMNSTNEGFSIQAEAGASGWVSKKFNVPFESGTSIGLRLGYGLDDNWEAFATIHQANIQPAEQYVEAFILGHVDIGAKYIFGSTMSPLKFYTYAAATYMESTQKVYYEFDQSVSTWKLQGFGLTTGLGLKYHFSLPLALNLNVSITKGMYTNNSIDHMSYEESFDHLSSRVGLGVVLYFGQL